MTQEQLPDSLREGLDVVFVGTAAGKRSAQQGAYYANRGNRFWRILEKVRLTPRQFEPHQYPELLKLGVGFTDLCKTQAGGDHTIKHYDVPAFKQTMARYRPRSIAFTSKKSGSLWLDCSTKDIGFDCQPLVRPEFPPVFVLPSPSGAASKYWDEGPWHELADWLRTNQST